MQKIRLGMLGTANVAFRRFVPSVIEIPSFEYVGLSIANITEWGSPAEEVKYKAWKKNEQGKAEGFCRQFGGVVFDSFEELLSSDKIDAVYIPLPPALHYKWAHRALECGKHVLLEKPFTTKLEHTKDLVALAEKTKLAIHENYAFCYHKQFKKVRDLANSGTIGKIRQIRAAFGFPFRGVGDFRYVKSLGGGALLDCGGYPIKLASQLIGQSAQVTTAHLEITKGFDVDIYGSATLQNENGMTAQLAFGMDNGYKCEVEIWGSKGSLKAPRIFTAPDDLSPEIQISNPEKSVINISPDKQFMRSASRFLDSIKSNDMRQQAYLEIIKQAELIEAVFSIGGKDI